MGTEVKRMNSIGMFKLANGLSFAGKALDMLDTAQVLVAQHLDRNHLIHSQLCALVDGAKAAHAQHRIDLVAASQHFAWGVGLLPRLHGKGNRAVDRADRLVRFNGTSRTYAHRPALQWRSGGHPNHATARPAGRYCGVHGTTAPSPPQRFDAVACQSTYATTERTRLDSAARALSLGAGSAPLRRSR